MNWNLNWNGDFREIVLTLHLITWHPCPSPVRGLLKRGWIQYFLWFSNLFNLVKKTLNTKLYPGIDYNLNIGLWGKGFCQCYVTSFMNVPFQRFLIRKPQGEHNVLKPACPRGSNNETINQGNFRYSLDTWSTNCPFFDFLFCSADLICFCFSKI